MCRRLRSVRNISQSIIKLSVAVPALYRVLSICAVAYDLPITPTPGADVYLIEVVFDLVVGRHRRHVDPVEGEVLGRRQEVLDGHAAAVAASHLVGQEHGPVPAVVVEHLTKQVGDSLYIA